MEAWQGQWPPVNYWGSWAEAQGYSYRQNLASQVSPLQQAGCEPVADHTPPPPLLDSTPPPPAVSEPQHELLTQPRIQQYSNHTGQLCSSTTELTHTQAVATLRHGVGRAAVVTPGLGAELSRAGSLEGVQEQGGHQIEHEECVQQQGLLGKYPGTHDPPARPQPAGTAPMKKGVEVKVKKDEIALRGRKRQSRWGEPPCKLLQLAYGGIAIHSLPFNAATGNGPSTNSQSSPQPEHAKKVKDSGQQLTPEQWPPKLR